MRLHVAPASTRARGIATIALAMGAAAMPLPLSRAPLADQPGQPRIVLAAVIGGDQRQLLPAQQHNLKSVVGLLYNSRSRNVCTAFCVDRSIVATAAHCLFPETGRPAPLEAFHFTRIAAEPNKTTRIAGAASGSAAQNIMVGQTRLQTRPPMTATRDWALVRLDEPLCREGFLPIRPMTSERLIGEARRGRIYHVAFHADFAPWELAYGGPCAIETDFPAADRSAIARDFAAPEDLLLHTCDTGIASSGSPLLIDGEHGPEVVGLNVGTYVLTRVLLKHDNVVHRSPAEAVANTGVLAQAFADQLAVFRNAEPLSSGPRLKELQRRLKARQFYRGPVDGRYGPRLHSAIAAYEAAHGQPITGLATLRLLQELTVHATPAARTTGRLTTAKSSTSAPRVRTARR